MLVGVGVIGGVAAGLHLEQAQPEVRRRRILAQQPANGYVLGAGHGHRFGRYVRVVFDDHRASCLNTDM